MPLLFNKRTLGLFVLSVGLLFNFIIPPFQNPDEPAHLSFILIHAYGEKKASAAEAEIIRFMDENNWWRFVGLGRPETLPIELSQTDFIRGLSRKVVTNNAVELYHILLGKTVRLFVKKDVKTFYYLCRFFSSLLYLGSILLVFSTFNKLSNFGHKYLILAAPLVLFLPQFAVGQFSVNPDALSIFISCLFFYTTASLFVNKFNLRSFLSLFFIAGIGFFTDKSVFSLVFLLFIVPLFFIQRVNLKKNILHAAFFFWILILLLSWVVWFFPIPIANSISAIQLRFLGRLPVAAGFFAFDAFNRQFFSLLFESFFLRYGWMSYAAEGIVYFILKFFLFSSLLGIFVYFGRAVHSKLKKIRANLRNSESAKMMSFFVIAFAFQLFLNWIVWASRHAFGQGRYLFPVIIPIAAFFAVGVYSLFSLIHKKAGKAVLCALVLAEFLFLTYAVWNYIVPVFHLTQKTPLAGI